MDDNVLISQTRIACNTGLDIGRDVFIGHAIFAARIRGSHHAHLSAATHQAKQKDQ